MSASTTAPARSDASYDWASRRPDGTPATLAGACPATRSDPRTSSTSEGDGVLELTARPLDPDSQADSGDPSTETISPALIARELADSRPQRAAATAQQPGRSSTSQICPLDSAQLAMSGAPLPAACEAALHSLLARYTAIAAPLAHQPSASHAHIPARAAVSDQLTPCPIANSDLENILFFHHLSRSEITHLRDGLRVVSGPRGTRIDTRRTLWIVVCGAVQTSLRRGASSCRVRVAGPGRCVGHLSLIAHRQPNPQPVLEAELRERAVLLEIPIQRANSLLDGEASAARRFQHAFCEDIARALDEADQPFTRPPAPTSGLLPDRTARHRHPRNDGLSLTNRRPAISLGS